MRGKLKLLRIEKGYTVDDLAAKFDISSSYYYKIEAGTRNPTMYLAKKISDFFGKEIEELFFNQHLDETSSERDRPAQ